MRSAPFVDGPRRIALVVHPVRPAARELATLARAWWLERGHDVVEVATDEDFGSTNTSPAPFDLAVSLGGDGTMLRTSHLGVRAGALVLGVNLGSLGYLTNVEPNAMLTAFERLVTGEYEIEERMLLEVELVGDGNSAPLVFNALNEAVIEKVSAGHTIRVRLSIGGRPFLTYAADGLLVATPTGSTAYNLSLRGPIVSPKLAAMIVTPISPHMLFDRSLVLDADATIDIELLDDRLAVLVIDGSNSIELKSGSSLRLHAAPEPVRLVNLAPLDFYAVLRSKFGLTDR